MADAVDQSYRDARNSARREQRRRQHRRAARAAAHDCSHCDQRRAVAVRDSDRDYVCQPCAAEHDIRIVTPDSWMLPGGWRLQDGRRHPLTVTYVPPADLAKELEEGRERARRLRV